MEAAAEAVFEHCHIFFLLLNTDVSAFASTSKGSSTEACPARPFGEKIGWTGAVMSHRHFFYSHLLIMLRCLPPVNSSPCGTRAHKMQDTQCVTWSQKPFAI